MRAAGEGTARPHRYGGNAMKPICRMLLAAAAMLVSPSAFAEPALSFNTDYVITLRGFTIARASFEGSLRGERYTVNGKLASAGLARIFDKTDATARAVGEISKGAVRPESFLLNYAQGKTTSRTHILFRDGNVVKTEIEPNPAPPSDKIIPITKVDLQSVTDPVAATLFARGLPEEICGRTLRLFEGGTRIDIKLSPKTVGFVYGAGNHAVTCRGTVVPVAGIERGNATWDYLRRHANAEFVYVPAGSGRLYMLHSISTRTEIGTVKLRAWRRHVSG